MSWRARLSTSLNELRVVYCTRSPSSAGTRDFVKQNYSDLKALNPGLPIYIRPCDGVEPHIAARYDRGVYDAVKTTDMSAEQVLAKVELLQKNAEGMNAKIADAMGSSAPFKLADVI